MRQDLILPPIQLEEQAPEFSDEILPGLAGQIAEAITKNLPQQDIVVNVTVPKGKKVIRRDPKTNLIETIEEE